MFLNCKKKHGIRKEYNNKGEVLSTAKYKNGVLDGYKRCSNGKFENEDLKCYWWQLYPLDSP